MAGEGERQIFGKHATAVVYDADEFGSALLEVHVNARAASIDCVFQQLLDDACRSLNDLAGGDLRDDGGR